MSEFNPRPGDMIVPVDGQPFHGLIGDVIHIRSDRPGWVFAEFGPRVGAMWFAPDAVTVMETDWNVNNEARVSEPGSAENG